MIPSDLGVSYRARDIKVGVGAAALQLVHLE